MILIGITGTIGSGKTAVTIILRNLGYEVFDADACVHKLYQYEAVAAVGEHFPDGIINGKVDRAALSKELSKTPERFKILESIIHPLVKKKKQDFLQAHVLAGTKFVFFDIPLLFETGQQDLFDVIVAVSVSEHVRLERVLQRPGMTQEKLDLILKRQMADKEKIRRADYVIDNNGTMADLEESIKDVMIELEQGLEDGSIKTDQAIQNWDL